MLIFRRTTIAVKLGYFVRPLTYARRVGFRQKGVKTLSTLRSPKPNFFIPLYIAAPLFNALADSLLTNNSNLTAQTLTNPPPKMAPASHTIVYPVSGVHDLTVIVLHGRDSTAAEFSSEFLENEASSSPDADRTLPALLPNVIWVFPQAELLRSERFDQDMSQWFDMWTTEDPQERSEIQMPSLNSSIALLMRVIGEGEKLISRSNIFLGGISQGFATQVHPPPWFLKLEY